MHQDFPKSSNLLDVPLSYQYLITSSLFLILCRSCELFSLQKRTKEIEFFQPISTHPKEKAKDFPNFKLLICPSFMDCEVGRVEKIQSLWFVVAWPKQRSHERGLRTYIIRKVLKRLRIFFSLFSTNKTYLDLKNKG